MRIWLLAILALALVASVVTFTILASPDDRISDNFAISSVLVPVASSIITNRLSNYYEI